VVGGEVVDTVVFGERVWVEVRDGTDTCTLYVDNTDAARCISPGDALWWQGENAYWTARNRKGAVIGCPDFPLERVGLTGAPRPPTAIPT